MLYRSNTICMRYCCCAVIGTGTAGRGCSTHGRRSASWPTVHYITEGRRGAAPRAVGIQGAVAAKHRRRVRERSPNCQCYVPAPPARSLAFAAVGRRPALLDLSLLLGWAGLEGLPRRRRRRAFQGAPAQPAPGGRASERRPGREIERRGWRWRWRAAVEVEGGGGGGGGRPERRAYPRSMFFPGTDGRAGEQTKTTHTTTLGATTPRFAQWRGERVERRTASERANARPGSGT